jgi:hypothetical protein
MTAKKKSVQKSAPPKKPTDATERLAHEVSGVAGELKKQNSVWRKLLSGIMFGAGTAIGATVVAAIVILIFMQTLQALGLGEFAEQAGLPAVEEVQE